MHRVTSIFPNMGILAILFIGIRFTAAAGIIGYDCRNGIINKTTLSLLDVDDCALKFDNVEESKEQIALLEFNTYRHLKVDQCKIEITRDLFHCGMSSHSSLVRNGHRSYIEPITRENCRNLINTGSIEWKGISMDNIIPDVLKTESFRLGDVSKEDGACSGGSYKDPYGSWDSVGVSGSATFLTSSKTASAKIEDDIIILPSGYQCKLSKGECIDPIGGYTFWDPLPKRDCDPNTYSVLYKGEATKLVSTKEIVYTVNVLDTSFSFTVSNTQSSCGLELLRTESSKLFIVNSTNLQYLNSPAIKTKNVDNMDIFQYTNAKFVYVERHIRSQMKSLFEDIMINNCRIEKEILMNSLAIASTEPDEFAYRLMEGPGYMSVLAGEAIHILKCVPVEVTIAEVDKCYNRLPVKIGNDSVFLTPKTHIIVKNAKEVKCNLPLPELNKLGKIWYMLTPSLAPITLEPTTQLTWEYDNLATLAKSQIYTRKQLETMRERFMFPMEKQVIAETVSQQVSNGMKDKICIKESIFDYITNDMFPDLSGSMIMCPLGQFGSITSGLIGIFVLFKTFQFVLDIIVNMYLLYRVHGWSLRLFSAFYVSIVDLTNLQEKTDEKEEEKQENYMQLVENPKSQK